MLTLRADRSDTEPSHEGKSVGRITSGAAGDGAVALAYVRREVPRTQCWRQAVPGDPATLASSSARAQDRAPPCGGRGRTFEPCRAHLEATRRARR